MLSICLRTEKLSLDSGPTHVDSMDVERLCSLQLLYLVVCWLFGCCVNAAKLRSYRIYCTLTCTHSRALSFSLSFSLYLSLIPFQYVCIVYAQTYELTNVRWKYSHSICTYVPIFNFITSKCSRVCFIGSGGVYKWNEICSGRYTYFFYAVKEMRFCHILSFNRFRSVHMFLHI